MGEEEKSIAKQQYQYFDRVLSLATLSTKKGSSGACTTRQELKQTQKENMEIAHLFTGKIIKECLLEDRNWLDQIEKFDNYVLMSIYNAVEDDENYNCNDSAIKAIIEE